MYVYDTFRSVAIYDHVMYCYYISCCLREGQIKTATLTLTG